MKGIGIRLALLLLGSLILSPVMVALGVEPMPGDIMFRLAGMPVFIPVTYSLCATIGLTLFYKFVKG